jgi:hypothetical protein
LEIVMLLETLYVEQEELSDPSSRRPRPVTARDSGDRHHETSAGAADDRVDGTWLDAAAYEWARAEADRDDEERVMLAQACTVGLAACGDALGRAESDVLARFPRGSLFDASAEARRNGGRTRQVWSLMVTLPDGDVVLGFGETVDAAADDLFAAYAARAGSKAA